MHEFLIQEGDTGDDILRSPQPSSLDSSSSSLMDGIEVDTSHWRVRRIDLVLLNMGWAGLACVLVAWGVVLLPSQVRSTVGNDRAGLALAAIVVVGSILTLIVTPLIGMLSDRAKFEFGKRRPYMLAGLVWIILAQVGLGLSNPHKPPEKSLGCDELPPTNATGTPTVSTTASTTTTTTAAQGDGDHELYGHLWLLIIMYGLATVGYQVKQRTPETVAPLCAYRHLPLWWVNQPLPPAAFHPPFILPFPSTY